MTPPAPLRETLQRVLVLLALQERDAAARADKLAILRRDGWLGEAQCP